MVYVLSYLCLLAATLTAFTPALSAPFNPDHPPNEIRNLSVSSAIVTPVNLANRTEPSKSRSFGNDAVANRTSLVKRDTDFGVTRPLNATENIRQVANQSRTLRSVRPGGLYRHNHHHHHGQHHYHQNHPGHSTGQNNDDEILVDDTSGRNERSTNLSHITGISRKIQMYITNRHLQILPDGTVNATSNDSSDYTILQRESSGVGQLRILGVATCQYLCMDACGLLYGTREFNEDCVFNEMIADNHYNTYSSHRYSNKNRTMYLAINRRGQPRKVLIRNAATNDTPSTAALGPLKHTYLGKMATYTRVLTKPVPPKRVEDLHAEMMKRFKENVPTALDGREPHPIRHHGAHQLCPPLPAEGEGPKSKSSKFKCRSKRKKRKKKRRKSNDDADEDESHSGGDTLDETPLRQQHRNNFQNGAKSKKTLNKQAATAVATGDSGLGVPTSILPSTPNESCSENISNNSDKINVSLSQKKASPAKGKNSKKQFTFTFNGAILTDCEMFKNVNKRRKCDQALARQRTKFVSVNVAHESTTATLASSSASNFHEREVDAANPERRRKSARSSNSGALASAESETSHAPSPPCPQATTQNATPKLPNTGQFFGDVSSQSSSRFGGATDDIFTDDDYEILSSDDNDNLDAADSPRDFTSEHPRDDGLADDGAVFRPNSTTQLVPDHQLLNSNSNNSNSNINSKTKYHASTNPFPPPENNDSEDFDDDDNASIFLDD